MLKSPRSLHSTSYLNNNRGPNPYLSYTTGLEDYCNISMAVEYDVDLERLSDVEATIPFTDPDDLARTIHPFLHNAWDRDSLSDHTVLITGFPIENFIDDNDEPSSILRSRKAFYLADSKILVFTMLGLPYSSY